MVWLKISPEAGTKKAYLKAESRAFLTTAVNAECFLLDGVDERNKFLEIAVAANGHEIAIRVERKRESNNKFCFL